METQLCIQIFLIMAFLVSTLTYPFLVIQLYSHHTIVPCYHVKWYELHSALYCTDMTTYSITNIHHHQMAPGQSRRLIVDVSRSWHIQQNQHCPSHSMPQHKLWDVKMSQILRHAKSIVGTSVMKVWSKKWYLSSMDLTLSRHVHVA